MRVLFIIPHFDARIGGAEAFAEELTRGLADRGHDVHVIAESGRQTEGVHLHQSRMGENASLVDRLAPDVTVDWGLRVQAHLHRLGGGLHRDFLQHKLLGRSVLGRGLKMLEHALAPKHRKVLSIQKKLGLDPQTYFLAVSHFVATQLQKTGWVSEERVRVMHNGVSRDRFRPEKMAAFRPETRAALGLGERDVGFLFVGHNLRLKNFALLDRVFGRVSHKIPNARLVVVGKRKPRTRIPSLLYAGTTTEPERFYAAADALLHPTFYDACSNVVLEALAAGLPVVTSNLNGSAELMEHGHDGYVLPVTGPSHEVEAAWLDTILRLERSREDRERLGRHARVLAQRHSMKGYVDAFEALLREIVKSRSIGTTPAA